MGHPDSFALLNPGAGWGAKRWPGAGVWGVGAAAAGGGVEGANQRRCGWLGRGGAWRRDDGVEVVACSVAQLVALTRRAGAGDRGGYGAGASGGGAGTAGGGALWADGPAAGRGRTSLGPGLRVLRNAASVVCHKRVAGIEAGLGED